MKIFILLSVMTLFDAGADARLQSFPIVAILIIYTGSMLEISLVSWITRRKHGRH
jgi:hypothetical protein